MSTELKIFLIGFTEILLLFAGVVFLWGTIGIFFMITAAWFLGWQVGVFIALNEQKERKP